MFLRGSAGRGGRVILEYNGFLDLSAYESCTLVRFIELWVWVVRFFLIGFLKIPLCHLQTMELFLKVLYRLWVMYSSGTQ